MSYRMHEKGQTKLNVYNWFMTQEGCLTSAEQVCLCVVRAQIWLQHCEVGSSQSTALT